jgi:hypothetical protein
MTNKNSNKSKNTNSSSVISAGFKGKVNLPVVIILVIIALVCGMFIGIGMESSYETQEFDEGVYTQKEITEDEVKQKQKEISPKYYEIVDKTIKNDSLVLYIRFNGKSKDHKYRMFLNYCSVSQIDPFTQEKETTFLHSEMEDITTKFRGWSVYVVKSKFKLDFDEHNTDEFICRIEFRSAGGSGWGWYTYTYVGEEKFSIYK